MVVHIHGLLTMAALLKCACLGVVERARDDVLGQGLQMCVFIS